MACSPSSVVISAMTCGICPCPRRRSLARLRSDHGLASGAAAAAKPWAILACSRCCMSARIFSIAISCCSLRSPACSVLRVPLLSHAVHQCSRSSWISLLVRSRSIAISAALAGDAATCASAFCLLISACACATSAQRHLPLHLLHIGIGLLVAAARVWRRLARIGEEASLNPALSVIFQRGIDVRVNQRPRRPALQLHDAVLQLQVATGAG